jgi:thioredoxin reductase
MPKHSEHTIAILGGGPVGLEAALYARYLGYTVQVYERGEPAEQVRRWGHVRMFTSFQMNSSPLGLAALAAQDPERQPCEPAALLTGNEWAEHYLQPLAESDLLRGHIYPHTEVLAISRIGALKTDPPGHEARADQPLRILLRGKDGQTETVTAQVVIDTTGVYGNPNWLGPGGAAARGESELRDRIAYEIPDLSGDHESHYGNQHTLVIGAGYSAATTITQLANLKTRWPQTRITWLTRRNLASDASGPLLEINDDVLPERLQLVQTANQLATEGSVVHHVGGMSVEAITQDETSGGFCVDLEPTDGTPLTQGPQLAVDRIVANVGYRPDDEIFRELHVHQCYATSGPMKLAATLLQDATPDCLAQKSGEPENLMNPEPNFYILGSKSYGRNPHFLFSRGLDQIRQLFTIIGERDALDLYETIRNLAT